MIKNIADIKTIAIIGSGTMGAGIAQVAASAGYSVILYDINQESLPKAKALIEKSLSLSVEKKRITEDQKNTYLSAIKITSSFNEVIADVIIEAIVEKLEAKQDLFSKLAAINNVSTIFATNTSSIPISQIAERVSHPERVVGMHFFNPSHLMKLVEVIAGKETDIEVALTIRRLAEKIGKEVIMVKDSPGFIVNRVARQYYLESLKILEEGGADIQTIDSLLENIGFKMGAFKLMDLIGIDVNYSVTTSMYEAFNHEPRFRPNKIQEQKVLAGHLGKKTGQGFYKY